MTAVKPNPETVRLLLVDDEPNVLSSLKRLFRPRGYAIETAENGAQGLAILAEQPINLVISDMRMPHMSGSEFLAEVEKRYPTICRLLLTGYSDLEETIRAVNLGHIYAYYNKPWEDEELLMGVQNALDFQRVQNERNALADALAEKNHILSELNSNLEGLVKKRTTQLEDAVKQLKKTNEDLKKTHTQVIQAFSQLVEKIDGMPTDHARRLANHARRLASELQLNADQIQSTIFAALLADIGKLALPTRLIHRPWAHLTNLERDDYLHHAELGQQLLATIDSLQDSAIIVGHQYESFDGNGKPKGLSGEAIPIGSRILAVVRDYDLMLEGWISGKKETVSVAQNHLKRNQSHKYDPKIVKLFFKVFGQVRHIDHRPIVEISALDLTPGMDVYEVTDGRITFLRDQQVREKQIQEIFDLQREIGRTLTIRVRTQNPQL